MSDEQNETFVGILSKYSDEFDDWCTEKHAAGAEKYGPGKFLTVDTIDEALQEIVDLANYARYTFVKLRLLQDAIAEILADSPAQTGFLKSADVTKVKEPKK